MSVKLADTLAPLGSFEVAKAEDISVEIGSDTKMLQDAIDEGLIGGGDSSWTGTHAEWEALLPTEKAKYTTVMFTDDVGESLIDDTTVSTDKVWSSNKINDSLTTLESEIFPTSVLSPIVTQTFALHEVAGGWKGYDFDVSALGDWNRIIVKYDNGMTHIGHKIIDKSVMNAIGQTKMYIHDLAIFLGTISTSQYQTDMTITVETDSNTWTCNYQGTNRGSLTVEIYKVF